MKALSNIDAGEVLIVKTKDMMVTQERTDFGHGGLALGPARSFLSTKSVLNRRDLELHR